jgi:hypothetical protein
VDGACGENAGETRRPDRHCRERVVVGKRRQHYIAIGKIGQLLGTARTGRQQCRDPFLVAVIDGDLMTICDEVGSKSASHMAETDDADAFDGEGSGE